jgi:hypothetical protein
MGLGDAIDNSVRVAQTYGQDSEVYVTMSIQQAEPGVYSRVFYGTARPQFVSDLPPPGTTAVFDPGSTTTTTDANSFTRRPTPGFSTRGETDPGFASTNRYQRVFDPHTTPIASAVPTLGPPFPLDLSLLRDPGVPFLRWVRGGPSLYIEIEAGGKAVVLSAEQDGVYLRAVGPSIADLTHDASYTISLEWTAIYE